MNPARKCQVRLTDEQRRDLEPTARDGRTPAREDYPHARKVWLVCDNLNTHSIASLYATFPPEETHRLARRLEILHTPRNGSRLNVAEIELSVLARQCLAHRLGSPEDLAAECAARQRARNAEGGRVIWKFATADARIKPRHLCP